MTTKEKAKREGFTSTDIVKMIAGVILAVIAWWIIHIGQAIGRNPVQFQGAKHLLFIEGLMLIPALAYLITRGVKRREAIREAKAKARAERS